jgi:hypothetical protein
MLGWLQHAKRTQANQGCQIFLATTYQNGKSIPNNHKKYQMATKYTKWPHIGPNNHDICKHLPLQVPPKVTQIRISV